MSCYRDLNPGPLPYQGSALPLSYNSKKKRAEDGAQTRDPQLGRLMLYQLSYFRILAKVVTLIVGKDGFEPPKSKDSRFTVCPIWPLWYLPFCAFEEVCFSIAVQRYNYLFKLQTKSIIFIAEIAHSSPLLPSLPPARSSACSIVLVVINP